LNPSYYLLELCLILLNFFIARPYTAATMPLFTNLFALRRLSDDQQVFDHKTGWVLYQVET